MLAKTTLYYFYYYVNEILVHLNEILVYKIAISFQTLKGLKQGLKLEVLDLYLLPSRPISKCDENLNLSEKTNYS